MSTPLLQLNHYFGIRQQPLHRVLIYAPTIIWVQQGHKLLWWQDRRLSFDKGSWLLIPAGHQLTFVNQPEQGKFSSHALTLLAPPPAEWLTEAPTTPQREPRLEISPALTFCFELVCSMASRKLSQTTQTQVRMSHALTLLQQGLSPLEAALACGYDSPSRFAARFKQEFGLTPHQYLRTCPSTAPQRQVNSY